MNVFPADVLYFVIHLFEPADAKYDVGEAQLAPLTECRRRIALK